MNKDRNTYLIIGVVFIALIVLFFSIEASLSAWVYNLEIKKKNAYGLYVTHNLLKEKYSKDGFEVNKDKSIKDYLARKEPGNTYTYLFFGAIPYFDSVSVDTLLDIVHDGSTVFLACDNVNERFNQDVLKNIFHAQVESYYKFILPMEEFVQGGTRQVANFNFTHPSLKNKTWYSFLQKYKSDTANRYFLNFESISDTEEVPEYDTLNTIVFSGYQSDTTRTDIEFNFGVFTYGKGRFVILLSTLPFTNYYMRKEKGLEYLEKVFAHVPSGNKVIWDEYSKTYRNDDEQEDKGSSEFGDSPLYFILKNKSLRMAWYLLLAALVIYAIFTAKRRQAIIPVIEPKTNTSLQYVETIGQLYYDETDHYDIANEMRLQFFNFLRKKYFMPIQQLDEDTIPRVASKTGIDAAELQKLAKHFEDIKKVRAMDHVKLNEYNSILEYFYKNSK